MKNLIITFLFLTIFLTNACKKEILDPTEAKLLDLANNFKFQCVDTISPYYFKGFLDNQKFCYFEGVDNYISYTDLGQSFHTVGTFLNIGDTSIPAKAYYKAFNFNKGTNDTSCYFILSSAYSSDISKVDSLVRIYFKQKGNVPLRKFDISDSKAPGVDSLGFDLSLNILDPITHSAFGPLLWVGDQTGSYLKITDVQELPGFEVDIYSVTFQINCKLYARDGYNNFFLWHTLHDAETRLHVVLPHHD